MATRIYVAHFGPEPIVRNEGAGRHIEEPFRLLLSTPRPVAETNHPFGVGQREGGPRRIELVLGQPDPPVGQVANHRGCERSVGLATSRRTENQFMGAGDGGGLLSQNWRRETLHPLDVDSGFRGNLRDGPSAAESPLHLTWAQPAFYPSPRRGRRLDGLLGRIRHPRFIDLLQQIVVQAYNEVAGFGAAAAREYQPIVVRGESNEMELSHRRPRRAEPACRALPAQNSSLDPVPWGIPQSHCGALESCSTHGRPVLERRNKPRTPQQPDCALFGDVDDHCVVGLPVTYKRHDAPVTRVGMAHDAVLTVDRQSGHTEIITRTYDGLAWPTPCRWALGRLLRATDRPK